MKLQHVIFPNKQLYKALGEFYWTDVARSLVRKLNTSSTNYLSGKLILHLVHKSIKAK